MTVFKPDPEKRADAGVRAVVRGNTEFAVALYQQVSTGHGNLFFSPHSLSTALAMTYAGARGETEAQIAQALRFPLGQEHLHRAFASLEASVDEIGRHGAVRLSVANALWPHEAYPLLESFLGLTREYYGAEVTPVDYAEAETARQRINTWIEEKTDEKIQDMIPPGVLDALTRLVLVNAIYFKGDWASPFDPDKTSDAPFWVGPGEAVQVPMMAEVDEYAYGEAEGLQVLELAYAGDDLSMVVLLPRKVDGLKRLEERLTEGNLARWTENLPRREVRVTLPRFEMGFKFWVNDALTSLGMHDAFGGDADFSGMDASSSLYLSAVLHEAFVAVDEEGTEAAAATAAVMRLLAAPVPPPVFCADHPFLFMIRENGTGSILFLGRVVNPLHGAA